MYQKHIGFDYCFIDNYCKICKGYCCRGEGYVFLTQSDIEGNAAYLNLEKEQFLKTYTRKFYDKIALANITRLPTNSTTFLFLFTTLTDFYLIDLIGFVDYAF